MSLLRRALTPVLTTALLAGSAAALTAPLAVAQTPDPFVPSVALERSSWAYVDKATPRVAHVEPPGDVPIGTWHEPEDDDRAAATSTATTDDDGVQHTARSFVAFDAGRFAGVRIIGATLTTTETWAADCRSRAVELWQTNPVEATTSWRRQPSPRHLLASRGVPAGGACLAVGETFDVTEALIRAVTAGDAALTLGLRVREHRENRAAFARRFDPDMTLTVTYNTPPVTPTDIRLISDGREHGCTTAAPGPYLGRDDVSGFATAPADPDGAQDATTLTVEVWRSDDPAVRVVLQGWIGDGTASFGLHPWTYPLQDATTYTVRLRADDGTDASPWTAPCVFTMDLSDPPQPLVTSADHPGPGIPSGDVGRAGRFTFDANGAADVVGFWYGQPFADTYVAADAPGGSVTVEHTPTASGPQSLTVLAVDRAGNTSFPYRYEFEVRESRPDVVSTDYPSWGPAGGIGVPGEFRFGTSLPDTVAYEYRLNDGAVAEVAAPPDGPAVVTLTPTRGGENTLAVRVRTASGEHGATRVYTFQVETRPIVESAGDAIAGAPASATFRPGMPGVVSYEYWFDGAAEDAVPVPAGPDGSATVSWIPSYPFDSGMSVRSRSADGSASDVRTHATPVDGAAPVVVRDGGGRPFDTATFTATTRMPGVVAYRWWLQSDATDVREAPAGTDGSATFELTPQEDGWVGVVVQAVAANGALSALAWESFEVYSGPGVSSEDYPEWSAGGGIGAPGAFTVTPNMPDVVEYLYEIHAWSGSEPVVATAAAGPDGSARIDFVPTESGYHSLSVRSRSADGRLSGVRDYTFHVLG